MQQEQIKTVKNGWKDEAEQRAIASFLPYSKQRRREQFQDNDRFP